jgi:hypothetical protein
VVGTEVVRAMAAAGSPQARIAAVETLVKSLRQGLDSPQAAL